MKTVQQKPVKRPQSIHLENQTLDLVPGQRGKQLLLLYGYPFATNLVTDKITYWCCRHRPINQTPCPARARTQLKDNGLYTVIISQPVHNHDPSKLYRKYSDNSTLDQSSLKASFNQ